MLDLQFIRQNLDRVRDKVAARGGKFDNEHFQTLDGQRRRLLTELEALQSRKNQLAKETGILKRQGQESAELERESTALSEKIARLDDEVGRIESEFQDFLLNIPNIFHDSVPIGRDSQQNVVVREWGEKPSFSFPSKAHWEIGPISKALDFERAAAMSGARFTVYLGSLAKLERVLIQFMLETHTREHGYTEVLPPFLVNEQSLIGTGNLPKFRADLFKIEGHNLYLIPTAEVPLTNIHRDQTLAESDLPKKYAAYTPCFRSEAGSHGKEIRGIIRQHQFNKVELLKLTAPEHSYAELESLTSNAEAILQKLGLHYRVVLLCSGDISFSSAKTYDIEVWMPARQGYMEISSCSNFENFQARRCRIKFKQKNGKKEYVHTLNGSGLAVGRTVAAIMENYQTAEGEVRIPAVLLPYFPGSQVF